MVKEEITKMELTDDEFKKALAKAYSYESRAGHGAERLACTQIGETIRDDRKIVLYVDDEGNYWYKTLVFSGSGKWVSMEQALFGGYRSKKLYG